MKFDRFEDIVVWQKSKDLSLLIYKSFKSCSDYAFRDQIQRASVSIMNNIAEGFERSSNKEFKHFLFIAKGSAGEIRSMSILALELNYIKTDLFEEIFTRSEEISKMLSGLIKKL